MQTSVAGSISHAIAVLGWGTHGQDGVTSHESVLGTGLSRTGVLFLPASLIQQWPSDTCLPGELGGVTVVS